MKNNYKEAIACFLMAYMTFSIGIGFTSAESDVEDINSTQTQEVISLRETNSKTYQLADGSYQFVGYAEFIHFEDENGQLQEINNAITDKNVPSGYAFGNTQNSWKVHFADTLSKNNAVALQKKNGKIPLVCPMQRNRLRR